MCVTREKIISINKTEEEKNAKLFPDPEYLALENISLEIARIALLKKKGKDVGVVKSKSEYSDSLNAHFEKVSDLFKYSAEKMFSEAMLDLEYIFGDGRISSFRI